MASVPVRRSMEAGPRMVVLGCLVGTLVTLLPVTACKATPETEDTIHARGMAVFPGEAFVALEIPSHGTEKDRAFIETSRSRTEGPSGLAEQLADALTVLADSEKSVPFVVGGKSSAKTKQVVLDGVGLLTKNLHGQRVLFVGAREDEPEVRAAIEGIGGRLLFAECGRGPGQAMPADSYPIHFGVMDVTSGGSMASADGAVSLFLDIKNTSTSTLWITTMLELPDGSQGSKVERSLTPGASQVFDHSRGSIQDNADYWISATAYGDSARSRKLESHRLHFRFSAPPR